MQASRRQCPDLTLIVFHMEMLPSFVLSISSIRIVGGILPNSGLSNYKNGETLGMFWESDVDEVFKDM